MFRLVCLQQCNVTIIPWHINQENKSLNYYKGILPDAYLSLQMHSNMCGHRCHVLLGIIKETQLSNWRYLGQQYLLFSTCEEHLVTNEDGYTSC